MPKSLYIKDLKPGDRITDFFLVARCAQKDAKNGKPYLALTLSDRTGTVEARQWDATGDLRPGTRIKVAATVERYKEQTQLKVLQIRLATDADELTPDMFVPTSPRDREEMWVELVKAVTRIERFALFKALMDFLKHHRERYILCPAAERNHQAYLGGLMEHALGLITLAESLPKDYGCDLDILIAAAIVHDAGKMTELCYDTYIGRTPRGALVTHVADSLLLWAPFAFILDEETRDHLDHVIVSHHGRLEWRALVVPMTKTAAVFHQFDMIDSRMVMMDEALKTADPETGLTGWAQGFGTSLWTGHYPKPKSDDPEEAPESGLSRCITCGEPMQGLTCPDCGYLGQDLSNPS